MSHFNSTIKDNPKDYLIEVNKGNIAGQALLNISGENPAVSTTEQDVWVPGGVLVFATTDSTLEAISTDVNDTSAGSGARTIIVHGLDSSFNEISESISMNGTSATTATTASFIRINAVLVDTVGTYGGSNTGDITVRISSAGATQSVLETGEGRDGNSHYTVPAGKTAYITRVSVTMESNKEITAHLLVRNNADDSTVPVSPAIHSHHWEGIISPIDETFSANHIATEKSDIWVSTIATVGTSSLQVDYDILLIDN